MKLCECGCGKPVTKPENRFIHGHNLLSKFERKVTKEELREMYWEGKLSTYDIGGKFGVSGETVRSYMIRHKIPRGDSKRYHKRGWKRPDITNRVEIKCKICGKKVSVKASRKDTAKYCSPECMYKDDDLIRAIMKGNSRRPTRPERKLIDIVKRNGLPYKYNGNSAKIVIGGKVPDFVHNTENVVVEVLGRIFHDPNTPSPFTIRNPPEELVEHYKKYGYKCINLWDDELGDENRVIKEVNSA